MATKKAPAKKTDATLTKKDRVYREWLNTSPDERKPAKLVAFTTEQGIEVSPSTVRTWSNEWSHGNNIPVASRDVADPHAKPKRTRKGKA